MSRSGSEQSPSHSSPFPIVFVGLLIIAVAIYFAARFYGLMVAVGPGISPDSLEYLRGAEALARDGTYGDLTRPIVAWPPAFSAGIASVAWAFGVAAIEAAWFVQLSAVLLSAAAGVLLVTALGGSWVRAALIVPLVLLSPTLLRSAAMVWSEPLFCLGVIAWLVLLVRARSEPDRQLWWWASLCLVAALPLIRYLGVAALMINAGCWLAIDRRRMWWSLGLSAIPTGLWLLRNYLVSGSLSGGRAGSALSWSEVVADGITALGTLFVPDGSFAGGPYVAGLLVLVLLVGFTVVAIRQRRVSSNIVVPTLSWVFVYLVALLILGAAFAFDRLSPRFVAPVYVPILAIALVMLRGRTVWLALTYLFFLGQLWIATEHELVRMARDGVGAYGLRIWRESTLVALVETVPPQARIVSNAADYLSYRFKRSIDALSSDSSNLEDLKSQSTQTYFFIFERSWRRSTLTAQEFTAHGCTNVAAEDRIGVVWLCDVTPDA